MKLRATVKAVPDYAKRLQKTNNNQGETVGAFNVWPGTTPSVTLERNERFRASFRIRPTFREAFELRLLAHDAAQAKVSLRREAQQAVYWLDVETEPAAAAGVRNIKIELQSSGARHETLQIQISAQVLGESLVFTPALLDCGDIPLSSLRAYPTRVGRVGVRKLAGTFKITALSTTLPFLQVDAQTIIEGSNYVLRVNTNPAMLPKAGAYEGKVIVETDEAAQPRLEIPLKIVLSDK